MDGFFLMYLLLKVKFSCDFVDSFKILYSHTRIKCEQREELYTLTIKNCTLAESGRIEFNLPLKDSPPIVSRAELEVQKPKPAIEQILSEKTSVEEEQDAVFRYFIPLTELTLDFY